MSSNSNQCSLPENEKSSLNVGFTIRNARPEDCGTILQYIKNLAVYEKEKESVVEITEKDLVADGFGESPFFNCFVAEEDCEGTGKSIVVGYAIYVNSYSTWKGKSMWIEDLYVRPESRGKGTGKEIVKRLSKIALEKGLGKIRWLVLNWNEIAVDFYKKIDVIIEEDWRLCTLTPVAMKKLLNEER